MMSIPEKINQRKKNYIKSPSMYILNINNDPIPDGIFSITAHQT
jgi:hypothetical protein